MRRATHLIVLGAFVLSCGGQWVALQCVAWVSMLHDYSQVVPFRQAVSKTFSGEYPCAICKAIAEKKESERQAVFAFAKYEKKFFPPVAIQIAPPPGDSPLRFPDVVTLFSSRTESPPTPPPRSVLG